MTVPEGDSAAFAIAVEEYDELRRILPRFREKRAWIRAADKLSPRITRLVEPGVAVTTGVVRGRCDGDFHSPPGW